MTVSKQAKREISDMPTKGCCRRARFSAVLRTAGAMVIDSTGIRVQISTDDRELAVQSAAYVREKYGGDVSIDSGKHISVVFSGDYVTRLLVECGVLVGEKGGYSRAHGIATFLLKSKCCIREYVKGAFLGCGHLSSDFHHLEFAFSSEDVADSFAKLIGDIIAPAGQTKRGEKYIVYYNGKSNICDMLAYMGANRTALSINEHMAKSDIIKRAVARSNCDVANIDRALKASEQQIAAIRKLDADGGLDKLDEKLATIAFVREANPSASLAELAEITGLTKSGVKHRLDKIVELAREKL